MVFSRRRKVRSHLTRQHTDTGWDQREGDSKVSTDCGEAHAILLLYTVNSKTSATCIATAQYLSKPRKSMAGTAFWTCSNSCPQRWARVMGTKMRLRSGNVQSKPSRSVNATPNTSALRHPLMWANTKFGLATRPLSFADPGKLMLVMMRRCPSAKPCLDCLAQRKGHFDAHFLRQRRTYGTCRTLVIVEITQRRCSQFHDADHQRRWS